MIRGRTWPARVLWALLTLVAVFVLWVLQIEIAYRENISRLPALMDFHRHVITRLWRA